MRRRTTTRALAGACLGVLTSTVMLAGCGSYSEPSPPTGIDALEVPTPSPDPADFVARIDNPWFVLVDTAYVDAAGAPVTRTVEPGPGVAGVATTAVSQAGVTDLYAQDDGGNVWWFGRVGEWRAGDDGAQAGLAMPADPRVGDGWRLAEVPGEELLAEVSVADDDTVVLEVSTDDVVTYETYVRAAGLDSVETEDGEVLLSRAG